MKKRKAAKDAPGRRANRERTKATNDFAKWLDGTKERVVLVAKKLEVSVNHVYNLRNGHSSPSVGLAARIEKISGGKVTAQAWGAK